MSGFPTDRRKALPLEGVRIVECGVWHAGPGGCAILADLGAEVIKVESLEGEPERTQGRSLGSVSFDGVEKEDWSLLFEISNRNKKGICLDIGSPDGYDILMRLVASADIFTTNLRKSTIEKLRLDYASVKKNNDNIIHASVSGFGSEGPMSQSGGFDPMGQAVSSMVFLAGRDEPVVLQTFVLDQLTAIMLSHAVQTALFVRERHGYGQALHVSLYGTAISLLYCNLMATSVMGANPMTSWDRSISPPMRNCYKCKDGEWIMGTNHPEHKYWDNFCDVINRPGLKSDPRFESTALRKENVRELVELLDEVMLEKTRDEWLAIFKECGLLFCTVQRIEEVVKDPQALINGYMMDIEHPILGNARVPGYPAQFSENDTCWGPAPEKGQHTDEIMKEVGYTQIDIDDARLRNIVK